MIVNKTWTIPVRRKLAPFEEGVQEVVISNLSSLSPDAHPNIFAITHKTLYKYTAKISHSKHLFRLQPLSDANQTLLHYKFSLSANNASVINFTGVFGNNASFVSIEEPYSELEIITESIVAVHHLPKRMDVLHQSRTMPMIWMPWDRVMMQAYLQTPELPENELFELANYAMEFVRKNQNDTFAIISDMNTTIFQEYSYIEGETSLNTTAWEVYNTQRGVCQDFANLLVCLIRLLGIPARYRMGYIHTQADYTKNQVQSEATHAWVEAFFPYMGWLGFDPTNGCPIEKNHVKVACGRHYNDATPTSGTLFDAGGDVEETLTSSVQVIQLNVD